MGWSGWCCGERYKRCRGVVLSLQSLENPGPVGENLTARLTQTYRGLMKSARLSVSQQDVLLRADGRNRDRHEIGYALYVHTAHTLQVAR